MFRVLILSVLSWVGWGAEPPTAPAASFRTAFVYDEACLKHVTGPGHPERPARLTAIRDRFREQGLLQRLLVLPPAPAAEELLTTVHTADYVERVKAASRTGGSVLDSGDTPVSSDSYAAARAATGGVLAAVDAVMDGKVRNAFCAVRPPGHHALKGRAMGFCLFNNVAIAARYLQQRHRLSRVLIVDWDVHHGNGTQAALYDDPTVFYFSTHQAPFYPGTGAATERGEGRGVGFTLNVPLPAGAGDAEYRSAFTEQLRPAADGFQPDFVLISAGFDAAQGDLLGRMRVTPEGYAALTRIVKDIAGRHAKGRVVSVLEGGYDLEALAASAEAHVRALME